MRNPLKRKSPTANELRKRELVNAAKKNKQDFKLGKVQSKNEYRIKTAKERAKVKQTRARSMAAAYQAKQATDAVTAGYKADQNTKTEIAKLQSEMHKSDNELQKYAIDKGVTTPKPTSGGEGAIINGGMETTKLSGSPESKNDSYSDRDKDNQPGYNIGMM